MALPCRRHADLDVAEKHLVAVVLQLQHILGGGDLFFPLLLSSSVLFASGLAGGLVVASFALLGVIAAYLVHIFLMKGRPTPALPPIFVLCLGGLALVQFVLKW